MPPPGHPVAVESDPQPLTEQAVYRRLLADVAAMEEEMFERVSAELPVAAMPAGFVADSREWTRRITRAALTTLAAGRPLETLGPEIERLARRRRDQGVSKDQSLRAYEVCLEVTLERVIAAVPPGPRTAALVQRLTRRMLEFQRLTTARVAAGYHTGPALAAPDWHLQVQAVRCELGLFLLDPPPDPAGRSAGPAGADPALRLVGPRR